MVLENSTSPQNKESIDQSSWSSLMVKGQKGDNVAYHQLLTQITQVTNSYLKKRLNYQPDLIDDCTQEVLLAIHSARHTYDSHYPFAPWFFAILGYKLKDSLRKHSNQAKYFTNLLEEDLNNLIASSDKPIEEELAEAELFHTLFESLPKNQQEAVALTKLEGKSLKEAARELEISESALKVRVHRAVHSMKRLFQRGHHDR